MEARFLKMKRSGFKITADCGIVYHDGRLDFFPSFKPLRETHAPYSEGVLVPTKT